MYVRATRIENLRTFVKATATLNVPDPASTIPFPNMTLLLGDNGAGKTTVLRAIVLATLAPVIQSGSGYVPYSLVRHMTGESAPAPATVEADLVLHSQDQAAPGSVTARLSILPTAGFVDRFVATEAPAWAEAMWSDRSAAFLVLGYGATREVALSRTHESQRSKSRILRYERVAGLFEEGVPLMPLSAWLPELRLRNQKRFEEVVALANQLLKGHGALLPTGWDDEPLFQTGGASLPFVALSDGYRAFIGWIGDMLYHLHSGASVGGLADQRGIVLVDEVDLHLHPAWQKEIIPLLSRTLPNLQFVLTSHSPLVVGSVHQTNVLVLETVGGSKPRTEIRAAQNEVYGLTADQILTGGQFGLATTRTDEFAQRMRGAAGKAIAGDAQEALQLLRMMSLGGGAEAPTRPGKPGKNP